MSFDGRHGVAARVAGDPAGDARHIPRKIHEHGVVGDLSTLALIATDGTVDFLCWPNFDSASIFAALLDPDRGGVFETAPDMPDARVVQQYIPDTNVLVTRWMDDDSSAEIVDFMPIRPAGESVSTSLIRRFRCTRGAVTLKVRCAPRFDYARQACEPDIDDGAAIWTPEDGLCLRLTATRPLRAQENDAVGTFRLKAGECVDFALQDAAADPIDLGSLAELEEATIAYWQNWAGRSTYRGRWREMVNRSALVLKLLTSRKHGSVIAAGTFGLPESPGGNRNWDYRATWIRDASFTVYALMRLGYHEEAHAFNLWIGERAIAQQNWEGKLSIMYAVDGRDIPAEVSLDHLSGYGGAKPVRVGNNAAEQLQLDIYGELMDSIYLSNKYGHAISHDAWTGVRDVIGFVCEHWRDPDAGIWEMRREPQEFLHSRLMCWVAVDRALRLATKRSLAAPFRQWIDVRNEIHDDIWANFWNEEKGHFVQTKGGDTLDASLLLMPLVRFVSATDPRWLSTLEAIGNELADDGIVHRYGKGTDGLDGDEGAFSACSFWYAECLARAGETTKARRVLEAVLNYANHLGLYAEEFDTKAHLAGNFPQAFTHLAFISAAFYLDRELDDRNRQEWRP